MPANAALYISDPSILGSRMLSSFDEIQSYEGLTKGNLASGIRLMCTWGSMAINFMDPSDLANHLLGFEGYVAQAAPDEDTRVYTNARIHHVRMSLGCVIEHPPEAENTVIDFLFHLNSELNGLLFLYGSIFDRDGQPLSGPAAIET